MKILVLNCGSSSIKYQLFDIDDNQHTVLAKGLLERIGLEMGEFTHKWNGEKYYEQLPIPNHTVGISIVLNALLDENHGVIKSLDEIGAIGHRLVHGGEKFTKSVLIDDSVMELMEDLIDLAPLHNPACMAGVKAVTELLPNVKQGGCFDTAFHSTMKPEAYLYPIPYEYYEKYRVRRYGFHGTSHRFVAENAAKFVGKDWKDQKIITCHLGNGCSMAAVKNGKVIDTTMGLTPLEGLMMGTRSGDMDPAAVIRLVQIGNTPDEVDTILNKKSGLLGIGGIGSGDMRDMLNAASEGNQQAELAIKMFVRRVVKYVGAYFVLLGGVDALVFTGGIGEYSLPIREKIVSGLAALNVKLDPEKNKACFGKKGIISTDDSAWKLLVMPTNEELMIARNVLSVLGSK